MVRLGLNSIGELLRRLGVDAERVPGKGVRIVARVERMFGNGADAAFSARYLPMLQREIDVAAGHASIRKILKRLVPAA